MTAAHQPIQREKDFASIPLNASNRLRQKPTVDAPESRHWNNALTLRADSSFPCAFEALV
jgi:hypothetical protein